MECRWTLTVDGEVEKRVRLDSEELRRLNDGSVTVSEGVPGLDGEAVALLG
ncbi:MAG: hypothetical protein M0Z65_02610 [Firmicutes bacterium]|nr:hypothetical protein [Bacillota bacterium]